MAARTGADMSGRTCRICGSWADSDLCVSCAVDRAEAVACPFGDPCCPCQDGDVCHYVATEDTPAMRKPDDG